MQPAVREYGRTGHVALIETNGRPDVAQITSVPVPQWGRPPPSVRGGSTKGWLGEPPQTDKNDGTRTRNNDTRRRPNFRPRPQDTAADDLRSTRKTLAKTPVARRSEFVRAPFVKKHP